ncbi:MAG TPA: hypothetical protein VHU84_16625 [Lacipirellulaceae bacterium]|jgi:hypothetical protein|nr:hypothetical protein [Lacipirellulaceae bacterium]
MKSRKRLSGVTFTKQPTTYRNGRAVFFSKCRRFKLVLSERSDGERLSERWYADRKAKQGGWQQIAGSPFHTKLEAKQACRQSCGDWGDADEPAYKAGYESSNGTLLNIPPGKYQPASKEYKLWRKGWRDFRRSRKALKKQT